jgi:hypothetical protein
VNFAASPTSGTIASSRASGTDTTPTGVSPGSGTFEIADSISPGSSPNYFPHKASNSNSESNSNPNEATTETNAYLPMSTTLPCTRPTTSMINSSSQKPKGQPSAVASSPSKLSNSARSAAIAGGTISNIIISALK